MQCMIKQHQIVQGIRCRNPYNPVDQPRNQTICLKFYLSLLLIGSNIRVQQNHNYCAQHLHYQKLQHILLASISKIFGFFPSGQLIGFLTILEGEKMTHLFFVFYHQEVYCFVLHGLVVPIIGKVGEN